MSAIGVLALQGDWLAHGEALERTGRVWRPVRSAGELADLAGLVLPGGESTALLRLLARSELPVAIDRWVRDGRPVLATCAGLVLAARTVLGHDQASFGWLDIAVERNGWGRQIASFVDRGRTFIRAPRIREVGPRCAIVERVRDEPALVRQGAFFGATFHPELGRDPALYDLVFGAP